MAKFWVPEGWTAQACRFALDPSPVQERAFRSRAGAARKAYNTMPALVKATMGQRRAERSYGIAGAGLTPALSWSLAGLRKEWNRRKDDVAPWWAENSKEACNTGLDALARGLGAWSKSRKGERAAAGFPAFKSARSRRSVRFTTGTIRAEAGRHHVTLPRAGRIRTHESTRKLARRIEAGTARVLSATLAEGPSGRWSCSFQVIVQRAAGAPAHVGAGAAAVGVDAGVKADSLLVTAASDGREIGRVPAPKSLTAAQARLRALQRKAARQQGPWDPGAKAGKPPSKRWAKTSRRIGRTHAHAAAVRRDVLHKATTSLAQRHQVITVETLNASGMRSAGGARKRGLNADLEVAPQVLELRRGHARAWLRTYLSSCWPQVMNPEVPVRVRPIVAAMRVRSALAAIAITAAIGALGVQHAHIAVVPPIPSPTGYIPAGSTAGLTPVNGTTGLPLGGVGTGAVRFWPAKGTFMAQESTPTDRNGFSALPGAAFQAYTDRGGSVQTSAQLTAASADGRDADNAVYPLQTAAFGSLNDVAMSLTAFGPFDQQDVAQMTDPYAFFDVAVTNTKSSAVRVAVAFQLDAATGSTATLAPGAGFATAASGIERAVYAVADGGVSVSAGDNSGFLASGSVAAAPGATSNATAATVELGPNQAAHLRFVYAWYNHTDPSHYYYSDNFSTAAAVATHGLAEFSTLENSAVTFARAMRGSDLPAWYRSYVSNTLTLMPINSIYTADGRLTYAEGCCGNSGAMDQMWNGRQIISELFPSLAFQELEYWASTQQPNGQIHHDMANPGLGGSADIVPWGDVNHPDVYRPVRAVNSWVDLNAGFIISFYETYIATGGKNMITQALPHLPEGFWPHLEAAGQRILTQTTEYGDRAYPYTFNGSKCTFDSGGPCDMYNAGLSADAYEAMAKLAAAEGDSSLAATYQHAFTTVNTSFTSRYLTGDFPATGFHDSSELIGQWIAYFLHFGQLYPTANLNYGISQLNGEYQPFVNGVLNEPGEGTWTPYMITHYGGLLAETGQEAAYQCLAQSMTQDAYLDRDYVFSQHIPMNPASPPDGVTAATTTTGQPLDYVSLPAIWRDYYALVGYHRDISTGQLWIEPHLLPSMNHQLVNGFYLSPEGDGTISETQFGNAYQNQRITFRPGRRIQVTTLYLTDTSTAPVTVSLNGQTVTATRTGTGYGAELAIPVNGQVGPDGLTVTVTYAGSRGQPATVTSSPVCVGANASLDRSGWTATASSSASGSDPGLALDGYSGTAWTAASGAAAPQWFELDLGKPVTFGKMLITPGAGPANRLCACSVYVSDNGTTWGNPVATSWHAQVNQIEFPAQTARYVKIVDNEAGDPTPWSIAEINLFRVVLPRGGWTATAASGQPGKALDGSPSTAWTTKVPQRPGDYFTVDMGQAEDLNQVVLGTGRATADYPASYALYLSDDGTTWGDPVATGTGSAATTISFAEQSARYLKVVETGTSSHPWSIAELNAHAPFTPAG